MHRRVAHSILIVFSIGSVATAAGLWRTLNDPVRQTAIERSKIVKDETNQSALASLLRAEEATKANRQIAVASMPCFWSGEGYYGAVAGVYRTTPGMLDGAEVVEVEFDPTVVPFEQLITKAHAAGMANRVFCRSDDQLAVAKSIEGISATRSDAPIAIDEYPKWYILQTPLKDVPMSATQACRINSALHAREPIEPLLTPTQQALYARAKAAR